MAIKALTFDVFGTVVDWRAHVPATHEIWAASPRSSCWIWSSS